MKIIFTQIFLVFAFILFSQINFEFQYDLTYPTDDSNLCNIQMYDVDNDDNLDIVLFFKDSNHNLILQCYQISGDFICERILHSEGFNPEMGLIHDFNNELIVIGSFAEECEIMTKVCDFQTGSVIDSLIIDEYNLSNLFPDQIKDLKAFSHYNELIILLGFVNYSGDISYETKTIQITYDGSLLFNQIFDTIGEEIIDIADADKLFITGFYYDTDDLSLNMTRYLKCMSKTDYSTITNIFESTGYSSLSGTFYYNWPFQFEIVTRNDNFYTDYGWMFQEITHDINNDSIEFINFDPNSTTQNWDSNITETGYSEILATTCIDVNNDSNYVMYFRGNSIEIRDRSTGDIIHVQTSSLFPTDIFRTTSNELLFFRKEAVNNLIKISKLEEDIYVNADEENLPANQLMLSNYPNPFNPSTTIEFSLKNDSVVELLIFNIKGQEIKTLANNEFTQGSHSVVWNGDNENGKLVSSGVYHYKLNVNGKTKAVKKCLLLK